MRLTHAPVLRAVCLCILRALAAVSPQSQQIGTVKDPELRVQIVSERSTFDEDPAAFHKRYAEKQVGRRATPQPEGAGQGKEVLAAAVVSSIVPSTGLVKGAARATI